MRSYKPTLRVHWIITRQKLAVLSVCFKLKIFLILFIYYHCGVKLYVLGNATPGGPHYVCPGWWRNEYGVLVDKGKTEDV